VADDPLTLLTVHAHPDDEASKGAPTVARYHADGVRTVLVCCTGGEEGDLQNPTLREPGQPFHGLTPAEERAAVVARREAELAASAAAIGYDEVVMLGYRDSEVVITYGDDQKGYPHPDHLRVHDISVLAFDRAGDPAWYPDAGAPFAPSKLYYSVWAKARMLAVHDALTRITGESPFDQEWLDRPGQDHRITTKIDVSDHLGARSAALRAHATQVDPTSPHWFGLTDAQLADAYPWEDWILARSTVGPIPEHDEERDLFAGLRERQP
jgi:mycothiol S-conjugate amidase